MSRRQKLSRADRERRQGKRDRRSNNARVKRRRELVEKLLAARAEYERAVAEPESTRGERCVCERCGLEQEIGNGELFDDGFAAISPCEWCGHAFAMSLEAYVDGHGL